MKIAPVVFTLFWVVGNVAAEECSPPTFYTSLPRDGEWFYGVARDPDTDKARDAAVRNLGKQVSGSIEGWDGKQIADIAGPGRDRTAVIAAVESVLTQTPLAGWEQDDFRRCAGFSYVLVRVEIKKVRAFFQGPKFKSDLSARLEGRVANLEAQQAIIQARMDSLDEKLTRLTKILDERDAAFAERSSTLPVAIHTPLDFDRVTCDQGNGEACFSLGARYETGRGVDQDQAKAQALYRQSCTLSNPFGCERLGYIYLQQTDVIREDYAKGVALYNEALSLYRKACNLGDQDGCSLLPNAVTPNGQAQEKDRAFVMSLRKSCDLDQWTGCAMLAFAYEDGKNGVAKDEIQAVEFYGKACALGGKEDCSHLATMYENGINGGDKDYPKAASLYRKACDLGDGYGCGSLGFMYSQGHGVMRDNGEASALYHKACSLGNKEACDHLSELTSYAKACETGDAGLCEEVGARYEHGQEVDKDYGQAAAFYRKGCDLGNTEACTKYKYAKAVADYQASCIQAATAMKVRPDCNRAP